jgi:hypothetical protein
MRVCGRELPVERKRGFDQSESLIKPLSKRRLKWIEFKRFIVALLSLHRNSICVGHHKARSEQRTGSRDQCRHHQLLHAIAILSECHLNLRFLQVANTPSTGSNLHLERAIPLGSVQSQPLQKLGCPLQLLLGIAIPLRSFVDVVWEFRSCTHGRSHQVGAHCIVCGYRVWNLRGQEARARVETTKRTQASPP